MCQITRFNHTLRHAMILPPAPLPSSLTFSSLRLPTPQHTLDLHTLPFSPYFLSFSPPRLPFPHHPTYSHFTLSLNPSITCFPSFSLSLPRFPSPHPPIHSHILSFNLPSLKVPPYKSYPPPLSKHTFLSPHATAVTSLSPFSSLALLVLLLLPSPSNTHTRTFPSSTPFPHPVAIFPPLTPFHICSRNSLPAHNTKPSQALPCFFLTASDPVFEILITARQEPSLPFLYEGKKRL